jgi:hypothetical protein
VASGCFESYKIDYNDGQVRDMNRGFSPKKRGRFCLQISFWQGTAPGHLIRDRDTIFNSEVIETAKVLGAKPVRTSFESPWQNGVAERFVGNCRRDLLDHVIVLNERHLKRLLNE